MKNFDVCIVGGGASGCMAAVLLAQKGLNVCVVDKFEKPAKKLLVTGNGKCNITNLNMSSDFYNQNIDAFLKRFNQNSAIEFFKNIGVDIYADSEGRCYPISNSAKTVQYCLINQFQKLGITFLGERVASCVEKQNGFFVVTTDKEKIQCKKIIFACGVNEFSKSVLKNLNIKYSEIMPSLVALKTNQSTNKLDGIRVSNAKVEAFCNGQKAVEVGEILFKDCGLSGICIFNLSSIFAKNKCFKGKISINLLKNYTKSQFFDLISEKMNIFENMQSLMESLFVKPLAKEILNRANIKFDLSCEALNKTQIEGIVYAITNFNFDVVGHYDNNQVVSGGVELYELADSLESKNNIGIYFCGEICNVDGVCGGYNLQWAWTSAYIAANDIAGKLKV